MNIRLTNSANYLIAILEQSTLKSFLVLIRLKLSTFLCESVRFESVHNELAEGEGNDFMKLFISGKRENAERVTEATAACNTSHEHIGNTTIKKDVAIVFFKYLHPFCGLVLIYLHQERNCKI